MANLNTYITDYCNVSFNEKPFCAEDNVAMCYMFYMPMELGVSSSFDDEPIAFPEAAKKVFDARGGKHKPVGLVLVKNISVAMMQMAEAKRFQDVRVVACTDNFGKEPAVQFNAGTFLLPNGDVVVIFRGTDDTLTGWKEDLDMLASENGIPSHQLSLDYLKEVASRYDGDIIVCGHSKGGYVATYAVMNSPKEIRDRVKTLYNNDGPGFSNYDYLGGDTYNEVLPRYKHIIPQSSFIGMMLSHDNDYTVVKSNKVTGAMQHELSTWQFNGDKLKVVKDLSRTGKVTDLTFHDLVSNLSEEQIAAVDKAVGSVFDGIGQKGLLDVKNNIGTSIKGGAHAWKELDDDTKKVVKETMNDARKSLRKAVKTVRHGEYKTVEERLEEENKN